MNFFHVIVGIDLASRRDSAGPHARATGFWGF